jgi:cytochrome c oxidase assembly protein subunit 15
MSTPVAAVDLGPLVPMLLLAAALAGAALLWLAWRHRGASTPERLRALTLLTLFLTFDLVLFGAFTRLTDSGLGCPDWPGCYGNASPFGAHHAIAQAQAAMPTGPVTHGKAWIEMVHRYLATGVGALLTVLMVWSVLAVRRLRHGDPAQAARIAPGWAVLGFAWVCLQGAFGALTVTMKLYPAIVTAHLLGGVGLLALLAVQAQRHAPQPLALPAGLRAGAWAVFGLLVVQVALGGWVSTNYAVLVCQDVPTCQGAWWPAMDFDAGFTLRRGLGLQADGTNLPFEALTAIHVTHRLGAVVVLTALALFGWRLRTHAPRWAHALLGLAALQLLTGLSNVVLGWPLPAAVLHTGGAALMVSLMAALLARSHATGIAPARAAGLSSPVCAVSR